MRKLLFLSLALYIALLAAVAVLFGCKSRNVLAEPASRETATFSEHDNENLVLDSVSVMGVGRSSSLYTDTTTIKYDYDTLGRLVLQTTATNRQTTTKNYVANKTTNNGHTSAKSVSKSHETTKTPVSLPATKTTQQTQEKPLSVIFKIFSFIVLLFLGIFVFVKIRFH